MEIVVHSEREKHENITQNLHYVDDLNHKNKLLDHILKQDNLDFAIVFTSTKRHADQLVDDLRDCDHRAEALHGDMSQRQRTRTITRLKEGRIKILVATDVAARGIDVQSITHVINFDLPRNPEDYVHRIGRTGRAGATGTALSFAAGRDRELVRKIEKYTGQSINVSVVEGLEPRKKQYSEGSGKKPYSRSKRGPNRSFKPAGSRSFKSAGAKPSSKGRGPRRRSAGR